MIGFKDPSNIMFIEIRDKDKLGSKPIAEG
jgi:hypothetical protein